MKRNTFTDELDQLLIKRQEKKAEKVFNENVIKFSESMISNGLIRKVAFDVYKVDNDPYENFWILEDVNGVPHLVRASDPNTEDYTQGWSTVSDGNKENVTLSYKKVPVAKFAARDFGFDDSTIFTFKSALLNRMNTDEDFVKDVMTSQSKVKVESLVNSFPELRKFI